MTAPADDDDKWLHRLIFDVELTEDNQIHPAAWERFKPDRRVPQWTYVLSGTSWKLGRATFLDSVEAVIATINAHHPNLAAYRGLIYQVVQQVRQHSASLALDVHIVQDPNDPSHEILVSTAQLKSDDGSISPDVATQLNQLFNLALAGSVAEQQELK